MIENLFGEIVEEKPFSADPTPKQMADDAKDFWLRMVATHGENSSVAKEAYQAYKKLKGDVQ